MSSNLVRKLVTQYALSAKNLCSTQNRLGSTYNAAVLKEIGKPLVLEEQKIKKLDKKQVRVQVNYCSVNTFDVESFKNTNLKLPFVPGYELAGEVLEVGEQVDKISAQVGDRVAVLSSNFGGFADQCVVDVNDLWRIPSKVKSKAAAVMIYGHTNAIYAFSHLVNVTEKSKIVISAGAAGLGLAAIDVVANVFKIKPFGVCDTEERGELVRKRGAFKTAYFKSKDLRKDLGLENGADIIYDAVGGENHMTLAKCAADESHIFYAAPLITQPKICPPFNTKLILVNVEALRTTNNAYFRQLVQDTLEMADQSLISAHISKTFGLKNVNEAIKFIEDKKCTGKVVIDMDDDDDDDDDDEKDDD